MLSLDSRGWITCGRVWNKKYLNVIIEELDICQQYLLRITSIPMGPLVVYKFIDAVVEPMLKKEDKENTSEQEEEEDWIDESSNGSVVYETVNENGMKVFKRHSYV